MTQEEIMESFYNITNEDVYKNGGKRLLTAYYNDSLYSALKTLYPEHTWLPWRFKQLPRGFWNDKQNHKKFFDWLGEKLGYKQLDDWYNVTSEQITSNGGTGLLSNYSNSISAALQATYPEHEWLPWKFVQSSPNLWDDSVNKKKYFDWLGQQLGYKQLEDWYNVTPDHINQQGGNGLLNNYNGSIVAALQAVYPRHKWTNEKFANA